MWSEYHHIWIKEEDICKETFWTLYDHYEFVVFPFGITNSPTKFMSQMNGILHPYLDEFVLICIDDILIYSNNLDNHETHLRIVLQTLQENQLYAKYKKCDF